jgi:succinate dehydrogenase/fumarate reductase cytochrome b subunit
MTSGLRTLRQSATLPASGKPAYLGMWTWLWQRVSSLCLMVRLPWHWIDPYSRPVRIAVLFLVVFHAMAGIRVMLTDIGFAERWQRSLTWVLAAVGLVIFLYFTIWHA